ncbi:hypothetical protein F5Y04DRAFT_180414 [Hypomontagnella monticulosa]|nr:hypothetical protein F5Y04DRAFT_180414 [Hypomontagnella monticulosa]
MAPQKGQPKPGKAVPGHAKKQPSTSTRPVVIPAIPLPMIAKQLNKSTKSIQHAPANSSANGNPASSLEAALADHTDHADHAPAPNGAKALQPAKTSVKEVNGSAVEKPDHATDPTNPTNTVNTLHGAYNGSADTKCYDTPTPAAANGVNGTNDGVGPKSAHPPAEPESTLGYGSRSASISASVNGTNQGANDAVQTLSQPPPATSPLSDQQLSFPPYRPHGPTHPLQQQLSTDQLPDPANLRGPPHMHHYQHHPHMSNGGAGNAGGGGVGGVGVVFGGFAGSHTPSPVPPPTGSTGFMPPPPSVPVNGDNRMHPRPNGHHHTHSGSNGFPGPINTQFRPDMMPVSTMDTYGQVPSSGPHPNFDPFSPVGRYNLSTPHSLHGSHASGEPNGVENGAAPPYPPGGVPYGGHGHREHPVGHPHLGPHFPPFIPPEAFARHPGLMEEGLRDSIMYFQDQFDSGELTDCTLELVSTKGLHHPVKINGHKLILARSPALKQHIMAARATDLGSQTITIESDDPYLRSDAWWSAVRRLYMFPLLTPAMIDDAADGLRLADDKADRFEFCLGYAAAGHLLNMRDVLMRGLQMAADFITWDTVEEALGFVFEGTTLRHTNYDNDQDVELEYGYGPEARLLLGAVMNFLVNAFPPNFELDPTAIDPPKLARIPLAATAAIPPSPAIHTAPTIARGTNMRNPGKPNRLSSIKFGDLPAAFPEDGTAPPRGPAKCSLVLSRILLNLPFNELRAVLASESNGVSGWNTAQDRYHAVADVVAEREARRLRAVEAVRTGLVPGSHLIQQRLSGQRRHAIVEPWDTLSWQEEVIQPRGAEVPRIVRRWVPQFAVVSEASQQQPPLYDARDSMV